ncbi:MAG: ABC transporter permease subunit [Bacillota bacterium]|nr:ABC transporter permease subunit [Bacillota bacterium]
MTGYLAFLKKEVLESVRSYRLVLLLVVFLILGIMNPLTAKLLPVLMENFMPDGMTLEMSEPVAMDSWMQFYKNVPQMGLAVVLILFSGILSREYAKSTLIILLTRGLSRASVILSKFTTAVLLWTVSFLLCFAASWAYTAYYWSDGGVENILFAAFCLWVFGLLLISLLMLGGAMLKSTYGNLLFAAGFIAVLFLVNMFPKAQEYSPLALASDNLQLLTGELTPADMIPALAIAATLLVLFLTGALLIFRKRTL